MYAVHIHSRRAKRLSGAENLRFLIGNRDATIESLRSGDVEIALSGRPPRDMAVENFPLGPHPYVLIASPEHRLAEATGLEAVYVETGETFSALAARRERQAVLTEICVFPALENGSLARA